MNEIIEAIKEASSQVEDAFGEEAQGSELAWAELEATRFEILPARW